MKIDTHASGQDFALSVEPINLVSNKNVDKLSAEVKEISRLAETKINSSVSANSKQIDSAVSDISEFMQANTRQLNFSIDEGSEKQIVKVTDKESGEVIRQIPSEEILELSERLKDLHTDVGNAVGVLFNKQV
ncbi:flagellar protein FlaG [Paraglaciecola sp. L3A3]|uniref:flagellar protein FlaG n=1 Tax=Paraglaciecola sp. L3A3 TaxID=2686358 RepID=UPI00131E04ED|nr:flagellar protein FlaG [Paraglaciecola sp. L3A3]